MHPVPDQASLDQAAARGRMNAVAAMFVPLRSGEFLDRARVRRLAVVFLAVAAVAFGVLLLTSDGFKDLTGRPLGADFVAFHVAGEIAREEGAAAAYDPQAQYREHQELLGEESPAFWPYLYPPAFTFIAMGLASLPYLPSWLFWMAATLALYVAALQKLFRGRIALLPAIAFPAVYLNFLHGQNGFLIAALFAFALHALFRERMILAGILFGLIAIKPQYGLLIPIALAACGNWRAFASAGATVLVLIAAPTVAFGAEVWTGFFGTMGLARAEIVEAGAIGFEKIVSVFSQARMLGAPVALAYAAQAAATFSLAIFTFRLWRSEASSETKGAGLIIAALLATPYVVDYDLVILAPAIALLIRDALARGFLPYEKSAYLLAAAAPLIGRAVGSATHVSIGLLALAALFVIVFRRVETGAGVVRSA